MRSEHLAKTAQSRLFFARGLSSPFTRPAYQGQARSNGLSWANGRVTPIRRPRVDRYDEFELARVVQGQQGLPQLPVTFRETRGISELLELFRERCPVDLELHFGKCGRPDDYLEGWTQDGKIVMVDNARPSTYRTQDLGAFDGDGQSTVNETVTFTGDDLYEIVPLQVSEVADDVLSGAVVAVDICGSACSGGTCGATSQGCQDVFAVETIAPPVVLVSSDRGSTWRIETITGTNFGERPRTVNCIGSNLFVTTEDTQFPGENFHYYAPIADVLGQTATWTRVSDGWLTESPALQVATLGTQRTWITGEQGVVYFTDEITEGPTVQVSPFEFGQSSLSNISAIDSLVVAVGFSLAGFPFMIASRNQGEDWAIVGHPPSLTELSAVAVISQTRWFVGDSDGLLFVTEDAGESWTSVPFPTDPSFIALIRHIKFINRRVGYMNQGGGVFRTWNGGKDWVVQNASVPGLFQIGLGICESDPNLFVSGGFLAGFQVGMTRGIPVA